MDISGGNCSCQNGPCSMGVTHGVTHGILEVAEAWQAPTRQL